MRLTEPMIYWLDVCASQRGARPWFTVPGDSRAALERRSLIKRDTTRRPSRAVLTYDGRLVLIGIQAERRRARQCAGVADG